MKAFSTGLCNHCAGIPPGIIHASKQASGWRLLAIQLLLAVCPFFSARAIVDARTQDNTSDPIDGSPWANMGALNGAGGIYLGAGWVLTAGHLSPGNISFGGVSFAWDGTQHELTNTTGDRVDGRMFHLKSTPELPRIPLVSSTPPPLSPVDFIGFGYRSGSSETSFGFGITGFYFSASTAKSWGNNRLDTEGVVTAVTSVGSTYFTNQTFVADFSSSLDPTCTSDEAQAEPGDSGGGVFYKSGSEWELAGMIIAIDNTFTNRPANTAAYADLTFALDITTYRQQILAVIQATPVTLSITQTGSEVEIRWMDTGVTYNLEATDDLPPSSWTLLSPSLSSTNGEIRALLSPTNSARFFRLHKQ
jgi:trypsin